jgi:hypothetical protein
VAGPDRPENSIDHDNSLLDGSNSMVADPAPSVSTGGTSCEPSIDAVQLTAVVAYAEPRFGIDSIPKRNAPIKKILIVFNTYGRTLCYLIFATNYGKILNMMIDCTAVSRLMHPQSCDFW